MWYQCNTVVKISIHALLAESDSLRQPSRSNRAISIHALLAESDYGTHDNPASQGHFYPRSPCGERLVASGTRLQRIAFLSTLSLRRATREPVGKHCNGPDFYPRSPCGERPQTYAPEYRPETISIHALLAESDP